MIPSCKTFLLNRRKASSKVSPSWSLTSAKPFLPIRTGDHTEQIIGTATSEKYATAPAYPVTAPLSVFHFARLASMKC